MGVRLIKYFLNEKSEKHKSYISPSADPIKTSEKQTILKKKPDIINQLKGEHIANICHGQQQIMYNFW